MVYKDGSTKSLKTHAEVHHPKQWRDIVEQGSSQTKITDMCRPVTSIKKYAINSIRRKNLNRKLVRHIVKDLRPLNTVRLAGFKEFCLAMDPQYVLPTEKTLRTKLIPNIYKEVMDEVQKKLDKTKHCSITTDGWTSMAADKYNAFTVHYIDWEVGELQSKILECCNFEKRCTSENLANEITRVSKKYKIEEKISLAVADNAPDIQKGLELAEITKLGCFAHRFNLGAKYGIDNTEEIQDIKSKLSKIVRLTKVSANAKRALRDQQEKTGYLGKSNLFNVPSVECSPIRRGEKSTEGLVER